MTQTLAIFLEAYRSLNAKKMFWTIIALSAFGVLAVACVGINERGIKVLFWQIDLDMLNSRVQRPDQFYKGLLVGLGIKYWLAWLATILALISTAGIFPDLITAGSIDLYVSKPISRLRLFITQYAAGLLFVTLQITIFTLASFLVLGIRGGSWEPGLFWSIPIVVCFFSYLFSVCVLLGLLTRSTVAALLLTLLFWIFIFVLAFAELGVLAAKAVQEQEQAEHSPREAEDNRDSASGAAERHEQAEHSPSQDSKSGNSALAITHKILYALRTVLPKTGETIDLLRRKLIDEARLKEAFRASEGDQRSMRAAEAVGDAVRNRSVGWIVGTSLLFEAFVLAWSAWIFCRRNF